MKYFFSSFILLFALFLNAQTVTTSLKYSLPSTLSENSGLIYFNGKIITHNDSGGDPKLYEIDTITGNITRTIEITNAINIDWEDIAQDSNYIYIGDIGNNNGNRADLKIYRILKSDYLNNLTVLADTINFSYNDQVNFTSLPNNNDFDCEAFVIHNDSIILFTKNWVTATVNAYVLPKTIGSHIATNVSTYNSLGLITGADNINNTFYLSGYNSSLIPFIFIINYDGLSQDIFGTSTISKHILNLSSGHQIEGICAIDSNKLFVANEKFIFQSINISNNLYRLNISNNATSINSIQNQQLIKIFPNPSNNRLFLSEKVKKITLYNSLGQFVFQKKNTSNIDISKLKKGIYNLIIQSKKKIEHFQIIKN